MDIKQADARLRELQRQKDNGQLDDTQFRIQAAKLLLRDRHGVFWLPDADSGQWFCNRGEGWLPADPHDQHEPEQGPTAPTRGSRRRAVMVLISVLVVLGALSAAAITSAQPWQWTPWNQPPATSTPQNQVGVTIASPTDGMQIATGQQIAVESTLSAASDLVEIDRVELWVNGSPVDSRAIAPQIEPQQTSLPLSQPWLPAGPGEYDVAVMALAADGIVLAQTSIHLVAVETPDQARPEPPCMPNAVFVSHVTILPGATVAPQAHMDKVWQVRNNGTCAWSVGYKLVLTKGQALGAPSTVRVPPAAVGDIVDLSTTLTAPEEPGHYASTWQLQSPVGEFFGPQLTIDFQVEALAQVSTPPTAPDQLQASTTPDGKAVRLTWHDRSDNEDAFRIYREDVDASIGLAPAGAQVFVDQDISCGHNYRYAVVAFNATGSSPISETAEAVLPPCTPANQPPTLTLTLVPTTIVSSQAFTITFEANDDSQLGRVFVWGVDTGIMALDRGRVFTCTLSPVCTGTWPIIWTADISTPLQVIAVAQDIADKESEPARRTLELGGGP